MKKETFSGTRLILCELLMIALLLPLTGCASGAAAQNEAQAEAVIGETEAGPTEETEKTTVRESGDSADLLADIPAPSNIAEEKQKISKIDISFDFARMPTHASNQLAIWVENEDGEYVKTIFVTNFTAARRGYRNRTMALSHWVSSAKPEKMSDERIDAISSATPTEGQREYSWDLTDESGSSVPEGIYTIYVEGTLLWESNALFSAVIDTANAADGDVPVEMLRSEPDNRENENMLKNVRISAAA